MYNNQMVIPEKAIITDCKRATNFACTSNKMQNMNYIQYDS